LVEENGILPLLTLIQNAFIFVVTFIIISYISPIITVILGTLTVLLLYIPLLFAKVLEKRQDIFSKENAKFINAIKDYFSGFEVIRSFKVENKICDEYDNANNRISKTKFNVDKVLAVNESVSSVLSILVTFSIVFVSSYMIINHSITVGTMIALVQLSSGFIQPIVMIMNNVSRVKSIGIITHKFDDLSNEKKSLLSENIPKFEKQISVSNLSFSYNKDTQILENINFDFKKGKKYAIVGASGCGKTTLVKLIFGYYSKFSGVISYDGVEMKKVDTNALYTLMSMIHQNVFMFNDTIKNNICLYNDYSDEELKQALKRSGVEQFINTKKDGIHTQVGENGINLSGGQRQRVAVARALIKNTQLLVLDEGTAALDMKTAYEIEKNLLEIENLTLIAVTHKMSVDLLSLYDEVLYMKNGKIIESGSFKSLLDNKGKFYNFYTIENKEETNNQKKAV
jgi:ABC-type bacteriocin/lantibiotic exporter with double-glycine peptidase domain